MVPFIQVMAIGRVSRAAVEVKAAANLPLE